MSEGIVIALITALGSLFGGIIGQLITASATIKAATIKEKVNQTSISKDENSRSWNGILTGALIGASSTLVVIYLIGSLPSQRDAPEPTPTLSSPPSQILLSEDFSDELSLRGYNTDKWTCNECARGIVTQKNDAIQFEIDGITGIAVKSQSSWQASQIGYIQAKLMISEYKGADNGDVSLSLGTKLDSGWWQTFCYIEGKQNSTKLSYTCSIVKIDNNNQEKYEYLSDSVSVNFGEWQTAKIEFYTNSMEIRFYLNDKLIGQHIPDDANELRNSQLNAQFGVSSNTTSRLMIANVDDVIIIKAP